jgi:hypothetical protein
LLGFSRPERVAMFALTAPQAAATLAVTLIGFEIGLFGTSVVNAVLVLIVVSIVVSAFLAERVTSWVPAKLDSKPPLGGKVLVLAPSTGPSDAAVRVATLLARPDGGHSDVLITQTEGEPRLDRRALRALEQRICRHGFDGHVRTEISPLPDALTRALLTGEPSLVIVDDPAFDGLPGRVPILVVEGQSPPPAEVRLIVDSDDTHVVAADVARRLGRS